VPKGWRTGFRLNAPRYQAFPVLPGSLHSYYSSPVFDGKLILLTVHTAPDIHGVPGHIAPRSFFIMEGSPKGEKRMIRGPVRIEPSWRGPNP